MKIYTRSGDQMTTGLLDGTRVSKHDVRIHLLGNIDELNSMLGVVKSLTKDPAQAKEFSSIQRTLMKIMSGIADISEPRPPKGQLSEASPSEAPYPETSGQSSEGKSPMEMSPPSDRGISRPKGEDAHAPQSKIGGISWQGQVAPSINRNATHLDDAQEKSVQDTPVTYRKYQIVPEDISHLEMRIDQMEAAFDREKDFVLPGGSFYSAQIDVARTVTRRCERWFAEAAEEYPLDAAAARYLNRLSDYLYVMARYQDALSIKKNISYLDGAVEAFDCGEVCPAPGTESFAATTSARQQTYNLTEDIAQEAVDCLHKKLNHSYDTFYTFCVCDADGRQLATNALEHHSVALSEAQRAAASALARATQKDSDRGIADTPENGGAALYIHGQLTGSVGVYGSYKKDTNEKAKLLLDAIRNTLL